MVVALLASAFIVEDNSTTRLFEGVLVGLVLVLTVYTAIGRRQSPRPVSRNSVSSNGRSAGH